MGGLITKRVTSPTGRVIGMTQNGRSAIVAIEAKGKPTQYVREKIGYGGTLPSMTRPPRLLRKYVPARFFERARAAYRRLLSE
jgi:hypothetical protein